MNESRRSVRVGRLIQQEMARIVARELNDPALSLVAISRVEVTDDLQLARVYFRLVAADDSASERMRKAAEAGFRRAAGMARSHLGRALKLRSTPVLEFHYDDELDRVRRVDNLLEDLANERRLREEADEADDEGP